MSGHQLRSVAILASLVATALVASHELIYLLAHPTGAEYARAMRESGHDRYWATLVLTVAVIAAALALIALAQLRRLVRQASKVRSHGLTVNDLGLRALAAIAGRMWLQLASGTVLAFLAQENLEVLGTGTAPSGFGVLAGEHGFALPVIALVSAAVALVGALVRWGRRVMLGRLRRAAGSRRRRTSPNLRPTAVVRPTAASAVRAHGLRAPPSPARVPA